MWHITTTWLKNVSISIGAHLLTMLSCTTSNLQSGGKSSTVKIGMWATGPEPNSAQLLQKTQLMRGAPPQLLIEYSSSNRLLLCPLALDPPNCPAVLPELPWTSQ